MNWSVFNSIHGEAMKVQVDGMELVVYLGSFAAEVGGPKAITQDLLREGADMKTLRGLMEDDAISFVDFLTIGSACRFVKYLSKAGFSPWLNTRDTESHHWQMVGRNDYLDDEIFRVSF